MTREIDRLKEHVIVCGYGRIGRVLAAELARANVDVLVVDSDETRVAQAARDGHVTFSGDCSRDATLLQVGIERARALCSVVPDDAMNVFITLTARNLRPELVIVARGENPETEPKLLQAGANRVVLPSVTSANRMLDIVTRPFALDFLKDSELTSLDMDLDNLGLRMITRVVGEQDAGRTVASLERTASAAVIVVAILRKSGEQDKSPRPDSCLEAGDRVVLIAHHEHGALTLESGNYSTQRGSIRAAELDQWQQKFALPTVKKFEVS